MSKDSSNCNEDIQFFISWAYVFGVLANVVSEPSHYLRKCGRNPTCRLLCKADTYLSTPTISQIQTDVRRLVTLCQRTRQTATSTSGYFSIFSKQPWGPPLCSACGAHLAKSKLVWEVCVASLAHSLYQTGCHLNSF
jgi:hypothetical protein